LAHIYEKFMAWVEKPRGLLGFSAAGDTAAVLLLLDRGCDIEQSWRGSTALMEASAHGHPSTVRALLDRGANINPAPRWNWDSFACAVAGGSPEIVQMFLERGADINSKDPEHEVSSLMRAAQVGSCEIALMLLERGVDINECDSEGRTALTYAREYHHPDVVDLLVQRGGVETEDWLDVP